VEWLRCSSETHPLRERSGGAGDARALLGSTHEGSHAATPTVNLIEGDRPHELMQEQQIGIRMVPG